MTLNSTYSKPFLTVPQQIEQLEARGMDCGNVVVAYEALEKYGYYRLSGYWHPYRKFPVPPEPTEDDKGREIRLEDFENGTTFSKIVDIYMFD